ncbi:MAG: L-seryl-tRNA(Sec) selenium transferase [Desulfobacterales bacterium]|nr:L-seryl-tRNA(Sec) selenium transferase [Desulfobacterales bacterium]
MKLNEKRQSFLKMLPGVDHILEIAGTKPIFEDIPKSVLVRCVRSVIQDLRIVILDDKMEIKEEALSESVILEKVKVCAQNAVSPNLLRVINATGVVVHTNLGRSILAAEAVENLSLIASSYSNLEFDLSKGVRGSRYSAVEDILCEISGAQAAMVVNNNAGAVLLCLETIAKGKKVVVSRGELVEIGGSFRIPDIMTKSGGILKEVGTTNRTHLKDYESAIESDTGLLLKVHKSNYSVVGFTAEVSVKNMVELGKKYHIPVMEDLGSGTFIDFSQYGLLKEPTVQESVATGLDVVTFSGDKLLGGPQAGIIVGKKDVLDRIKQNPLTRALRIDKLTLAALESTLRLYLDKDKAIAAIPALRMLTLSYDEIAKKADRLCNLLKNINHAGFSIKLIDLSSQAGGGALPLLDLPSRCVGIHVKGLSVNAVERYMRNNTPPIIGRIEDDLFIIDLRTVQEDELQFIESAFSGMFGDI